MNHMTLKRNGARSNDNVSFEEETSPRLSSSLLVSPRLSSPLLASPRLRVSEISRGKQFPFAGRGERSRTESTESELRRRKVGTETGAMRDLYSRAIQNDISVVARILGILGCRPRFLVTGPSRPFRSWSIPSINVAVERDYHSFIAFIWKSLCCPRSVGAFNGV